MTQESYRDLFRRAYGNETNQITSALSHMAEELGQDCFRDLQEALERTPEIVEIVEKFWGGKVSKILANIHQGIALAEETTDLNGQAIFAGQMVGFVKLINAETGQLSESFRQAALEEVEEFLAKTPEEEINDKFHRDYKANHIVTKEGLVGFTQYLKSTLPAPL